DRRPRLDPLRPGRRAGGRPRRALPRGLAAVPRGRPGAARRARRARPEPGAPRDRRPGEPHPRPPARRRPSPGRARPPPAPGGARAPPLGSLAALLAAAYRSAAGRRPVPSGGALYPLELYVLALSVDGLEPGAYHYHPFRHRLERLGGADRRTAGAALVDPSLADRAAALLVVTAMFWRSRFKYGLRGYRFALLEAGHLVQNAVLAAAALAVPALPLGGFYDRRLDALVGADGLDEATVYALLLGGRQ